MRERNKNFAFNFRFIVKFCVEWYLLVWSFIVLQPFSLEITFNAHAIIIRMQIISKINIDPMPTHTIRRESLRSIRIFKVNFYSEFISFEVIHFSESWSFHQILASKPNQNLSWPISNLLSWPTSNNLFYEIRLNLKLGSSEQYALELIQFVVAVELTNIVVIRSTC